MGKYCHDGSIHHCLIKCEECLAYYDDNESENWLITEQDQRDFIKEEIRAEAIRDFVEWLNENVYISYGVTIVKDVEYTRFISFMELLAMYEKERKNGEH